MESPAQAFREVTSELRPEESKGLNPVKSQRSIPGWGDSKYKGPEAGGRLTCSKHCKNLVWCGEGRVVGDGVRGGAGARTRGDLGGHGKDKSLRRSMRCRSTEEEDLYCTHLASFSSRTS